MSVKTKKEVYKCSICGNIVEVLNVGGGTLVCCGKEMVLQKENTSEGAKEKHIPVIEKTENGFLVKVGSVAHPMEEKHYIQWVELIIDDVSYKKFLKPGDKPEVEFCNCIVGKNVFAREYCNLHGLWKSS
jgi:superoxide reductase